MTKNQRFVLLIGAVGVLHTSMVPPVSQIGESTCRYHGFVERSLFFTRTYGVNNGDTVAMLSEYGIVLSLTLIAFLVAGVFRSRG